MLIALDYDDTFTADREFWLEFIQLAKKYGHDVICATSRFNNSENRQQVKGELPIPVYFCDHNYKREMLAKAGRRVDVWIDDSPESIGEKDKRFYSVAT